MIERPSGTVTLLFTDIEGSTRLLERLGRERYAEVLEVHRSVLRAAFERYGGFEVGTEGDSFFVVFGRAEDAVAAAGEGQRALVGAGWPGGVEVRVRVGVHTGEPLISGGGYVGMDVHRAARIMAAGHGGQVLVSETTAGLLDGMSLRDLGRHRLKDLLEPIRLYQLEVEGVPGEFPPLRSLHPTNLPAPGTPFLGREDELGELQDLLVAEDARVVTVTGPGGVGKTRLVLQAAAEVSDVFADGVFWVGLAPLRDGSLLAATVAQTLELTEHSDRTVTESVIAALATRRALLLVDNCEHLLDAVAAFVRELVVACPPLVVACSSRERLGLRSERVFPVPPMASADGEALFVERARAVEPGFALDEHVPAICKTLDGLPLAIELAAARVRSLSTGTIRERLAERLPLLASRDRDREARQRTLEATIAWSYNLLAADEQKRLRALSVFAGGSTLEACQVVADADLDLLESLLDKSLLHHRIDEADQDRYWLLETVREYAAARLEEVGESDFVTQAHCDYFVRWAATLAGDRLIPLAANVALFGTDRANFRVAFADALARRDGAAALSLVASLAGIWLATGEEVDSYVAVQAALALPGGDDRDRGWALERAALIASDFGRHAEAQGLFTQAEESARQRGDRLLLCEVVRHRSIVFGRIGEYEQAAEWARRAVQLARELGSDELEERCLDAEIQVAIAAATQRDPPDRDALERCLATVHELEARSTASGNGRLVHSELAEIFFNLGRYGEALARVQAHLRHFRPGSHAGATGVLDAAIILGGLGDHTAAATLSSAALRYCDEQCYQLGSASHRYLARLEADARQALGADAHAAAIRTGQALTIEEAAERALNYPTPEPRITIRLWPR